MRELPRFLFKTRGVYPLLSISVMLILKSIANSRISGGGYAISLAFSLLALTLRIWAAGFLDDTVTSGQAHGVFVTAGPYAYVRHPMYLAAMLLGFLFAMMSGLWYAILVWIVGDVLVYRVVISYEEKLLRAQFGGEYAEYRRQIPCLVPASKGYAKRNGIFRMSGPMVRNMIAEFITLSVFWLSFWWI